MNALSMNIEKAAAENAQFKAAHAEASKLCKEYSKQVEKLELDLEHAKKEHEVKFVNIAYISQLNSLDAIQNCSCCSCSDVRQPLLNSFFYAWKWGFYLSQGPSSTRASTHKPRIQLYCHSRIDRARHRLG